MSYFLPPLPPPPVNSQTSTLDIFRRTSETVKSRGGGQGGGGRDESVTHFNIRCPVFFFSFLRPVLSEGRDVRDVPAALRPPDLPLNPLQPRINLSPLNLVHLLNPKPDPQ